MTHRRSSRSASRFLSLLTVSSLALTGHAVAGATPARSDKAQMAVKFSVFPPSEVQPPWPKPESPIIPKPPVEPQPQTVEIELGQPLPDALSMFVNSADFPEDYQVIWWEKPDVSSPGTKQGKINIRGKNLLNTSVDVTVVVKEPQAGDPQPPKTGNDADSGASSTGSIVGIVAGIVALLGLVGAGFWLTTTREGKALVGSSRGVC